MGNLRDGSRPQVRLEVVLDALIGRIVGRPDLRLSQEEMMDVFWQVMNEKCPARTLEQEDAFWQRWCQLVLQQHGVNNESADLAAEICRRFPFHRMMSAFPESEQVLR